MRAYIFAHMLALTEAPKDSPWCFSILAAIWYAICLRFAEFPGSEPVFWMSVCWAADFFLGSLIAIGNSIKVVRGTATAEQYANRWAPHRVGRSVLKWVVWYAVFALTFGLHKHGLTGSIACLIEGAVMLHEGSSALRNAGVLTGARWMAAIAHAGEEGADRAAAAVATKLDEILPDPAVNGVQKPYPD